jgi:hypothetical protein
VYKLKAGKFITEMDNRKTARYNSTNLLSYVCMNKDNVVIQQGMGKTLDVSKGGVLLETHIPLEPDSLIMVSIGFEENTADIYGDIIYSREKEDDDSKFESGIKFHDITMEGHSTLNKFIQKFNSGK